MLVIIHDLVVEDGEVEGETKSNRVASVEGLRQLLSLLVATEGTVLDGLELVVSGRLGNVSVVVTNHLLEEGLGLVIGSKWEALGLDDVDDLDALVIELSLDLLLVGLESVTKLGVFGVLLDSTNGSNGASLGTDEVLETNGEVVSLIDGEVLTVLGVDGLLEDCLLYTSPSPRDRQKSRMPSSD